MAYSKTDLARIRWKCRRGMLELDEILQSFFDRHFASLAPAQQQTFIELLERPDPELFSWLMGATQPLHPDWQALIQQIRTTRQVE